MENTKFTPVVLCFLMHLQQRVSIWSARTTNTDTDGIWIALRLLSWVEKNGKQLCCILLCIFSLCRTLLKVPGIHIMWDVHMCVFKDRRAWGCPCVHTVCKKTFEVSFCCCAGVLISEGKNIKVQSHKGLTIPADDAVGDIGLSSQNSTNFDL